MSKRYQPAHGQLRFKLVDSLSGNVKAHKPQIIREALADGLNGRIVSVPTHDIADYDNKVIVAYHEAGHACIGAIFNNEVSVEIYTDSDSWDAGCTEVGEESDESFTMRDFDEAIMIKLAGKIASEALLGIKDAGASTDYSTIFTYCEHICDSGLWGHEYCDFIEHSEDWVQRREQIVNSYLDALTQRTIALVDDANDFIDEVAQELINKGKLSNSEIQKIKKRTFDNRNKDQI